MPRQLSIHSEAKLIHRYEAGCGYSCAQELAIDVGGIYGKNPDDRVAVRFCSKETFPVALSTSAAAYKYAISILKDSYGYTSDRVLFLRSEDCLGPNSAVATTEFWVVPRGAALPPSNELAKYSQVEIASLGTQGLINSKYVYNQALKTTPFKMRARPNAVAVVVGYYYHTPSQLMKKRLRVVGQTLQRAGIPRQRYFVRLSPWNGEHSLDLHESEPKYPSFFIIEIADEKRK